MLIDLLIVLGVGFFIATRFFGFKLPRDENLKNRKKPGAKGPAGNPAWQEMMDKLRQPDPLQPAEEVAVKPARRVVPKVKVPAGVKGLAAIQAVDESFDEARFLAGVETAYRYYYDRWNAMDEAGLDNLCGPQVMTDVREGLADFKSRGVKPLVTVEELKAMSIADGRVMGRSEIIDVDITARQSEGEVGQVAPTREVKVRWVLARAVGNEDPNWELQSIVPLGGKTDA